MEAHTDVAAVCGEVFRLERFGKYSDESDEEAVRTGGLKSLLSAHHLTARYFLQLSFFFLHGVYQPHTTRHQKATGRRTLSTNSSCHFDCV